jgi:protein-S-isoprenylcysteine O-methyltransferase Ste14
VWHRPVRPLAAVVVLGTLLFILAWIFSDDKHGVASVLGGVGWFGFLLCLLAAVILLVVWGILWATGRARTEPPVA